MAGSGKYPFPIICHSDEVTGLYSNSLQMHQENGMPFKSFVTTLMDLLEDADGMVRDTARNAVIELFKYVQGAISWVSWR